MDKFQLVSDYKLSGDQPEAVDALVKGIESGMREQTLMGVTGSGKTFTMANVIARINRPRSCLPIIRYLPLSFALSSRSFFRTMPWNISCPTMTIISLKPMCLARTSISKRTALLMTR